MTLAYLNVDCFLTSALDSQVLDLARRIGLIDALERESFEIARIPIPDGPGKMLFLGQLVANNVVEVRGDVVALTDRFRAILSFRDLLEAKIAFNTLVAKDVTDLFPSLVGDLPDFMARSTTFELFRYDRCQKVTDENLAAARRWMSFTTALSRYEGQALADAFDFSGFERLLDVGGNSGEFALQMCRRASGLRATIFDLPVVCNVGRSHVADAPEAARLSFIPGDMRHDEIPQGFDLVTFKSVLHDWPEREACALLRKACRSVSPGGSLLIFERAPLQLDAPVPFAQFANIVFVHFFRSADVYLATLAEAGFSIDLVSTLRLETDFHVVVATKSNV